MPSDENQDLESELRGIAAEEAQKAQKEVIFPDVQKVSVENWRDDWILS